MKTPLIGLISLYGSTGEQPRVQFIGKKSLNKEGFVINHKFVYDIKEEDVIKFLKLSYLEPITVTPESSFFMEYLTATWDRKQFGNLEVEYTPGPNAKSWEEHAKETAKKIKEMKVKVEEPKAE